MHHADSRIRAGRNAHVQRGLHVQHHRLQARIPREPDPVARREEPLPAGVRGAGDDGGQDGAVQAAVQRRRRRMRRRSLVQQPVHVPPAAVSERPRPEGERLPVRLRAGEGVPGRGAAAADLRRGDAGADGGDAARHGRRRRDEHERERGELQPADPELPVRGQQPDRSDTRHAGARAAGQGEDQGPQQRQHRQGEGGRSAHAHLQSVATLVLLLLAARPAAASNHLIAIDEVLGSWQGNDEVQFISLRMLAPGQQFLSNSGGRGGSDLLFDDASGEAATRVVYTFTHDLTNGLQGARILIATPKLAAPEVAGIEPDFTLPPHMLSPRAGRVCYRVNPPQAEGQTTGVIDCVAYGKFTGDNGPYGPPTPITPDDRSIQRVALNYRNVDDWTGVLRPTPTNNAGAAAMLDTLCGDGLVSQGEECDGTALAGKTCASL